MTNIIIKDKHNRIDAWEVLKDNGFEVISSWFNDNIFKKDGKHYGISSPVWTVDSKGRCQNVRIHEKEVTNEK